MNAALHAAKTGSFEALKWLVETRVCDLELQNPADGMNALMYLIEYKSPEEHQARLSLLARPNESRENETTLSTLEQLREDIVISLASKGCSISPFSLIYQNELRARAKFGHSPRASADDKKKQNTEFKER